MKKLTKKQKKEIKIIENYCGEIDLAIVLKIDCGEFWEYVNIKEGKYGLELRDKKWAKIV